VFTTDGHDDVTDEQNSNQNVEDKGMFKFNAFTYLLTLSISEYVLSSD
jgi:hypothetical protein